MTSLTVGVICAGALDDGAGPENAQTLLVLRIVLGQPFGRE